jgi:hypothetical protein
MDLESARSMRTLLAVAGGALTVVSAACKSDDCPNFPMFGDARIESVESVATGTDVRVAWNRDPADELERGYYERSMSFEAEATGASDVDAT